MSALCLHFFKCRQCADILHTKNLDTAPECRHNADKLQTFMTKETARQSLTGLIRSRMATYQARQLAGVTQKTFAEELTAEGHAISYADFRTLYARARKQLEAREAKQQHRPTPPAAEGPSARTAAGNDKDDPLTRNTGFDFKGTKSFNTDDLI